ncbi:MAG: amidohydrolase family protein [Chloroflexi bacterium]|nr:amidohydrolase family protein [Chloroflexota bacterium]
MLLNLPDFRPQPKLVVPSIAVLAPRFPVVDAHNHLGIFGGNYDRRKPQELFARMDEAGVTHYVDLDGGWGESVVRDRLERFKAYAPDRYCVFAGVPWAKWREHGDAFGDYAARRLREQARWGAQGLKIWKNFGLHERDQNDAVVSVDDVRLDPLWATAGELGLPVVIHVADPVAFFDPVDARNERWEELHAHPDWMFPSPPFPPFMTIMEQFARLVERHPQTKFIGAHVGCYAENLAWVSALLDRCPNFYVDISARIGELGRQPYSARRFFLKYSDRIFFGIDAGPDIESYRLYYRFLETDDEYFNYSAGSETPLQGRWNIYGLHLPDDVLRRVYAGNALRLFRFG